MAKINRNVHHRTVTKYGFQRRKPVRILRICPVYKEKFTITLQSYNRDTLDPQQNSRGRETFLQQFDWSRSALTAEQFQEMRELLVDYIDIFAKHRFDVGYNTELKIQINSRA